jgi:hypothetical protein
MGAAWLVAAIGFGGAVFMLRFLLALLREGAPSVCCWVVPVRRKPEKEKDLEALSRIYADDNCRTTEAHRSECYRQLLENENHEQGKYGSGPITLDGRIVSGRLGWRAIPPKHSYVLREPRLWFE